MSSFSDYIENELIKHIFRTGTYTKPTVLAVALYTSDPTDADTGTEVSGGGYARVDVPPLDANWDAPGATDGTTANTATVTFPTPTGANWGTVTHWGIKDALTGGNLLIHAPLDTPRVINDGDPAPVYDPAALTVILN